MTNTERQRAFRAKMKARGGAQVHGWVYRHQSPDLQALIKFLGSNPDLEVGPVRDTRTGKLVKIPR